MASTSHGVSHLAHGPIHPYINGKTCDSSSSHAFHTIDPSTSTPVALIRPASHADVDTAIEEASVAFPAWSARPAVERARILHKAANLLREKNDELAKLETLDTGKPFSETSTVDVVTGADVVEFFANLVGGAGLNGETTQLREEAYCYTRREALGVCAGIGAWNYPLQIQCWKMAPCLAAGNTMVFKPSEVTPLSSNLVASIFTEAGLPSGVLNIVHGDGPSVGSYLVSHPRIAKVSFTGQVSTGQRIAGQAAGDMKYVTMELGGKSPLLVLPDANIETAVEGAMMANFFSTGQVCTNGTRVFVPRSMQKEFEKTLLAKMKHVRMGAPMDADTNFGPLVSEQHLKKVQRYMKDGVETDKAPVLYDGSKQHQALRHLPADLQKGYWCPPMIFTECTDDMLITREEIFGPVLCILPYADTSPVPAISLPPSQSLTSTSSLPPYLPALLHRANDTSLGLAAGVFTKDINLAHRCAAALQAGILWVNSWGESPAEMSVGGWKGSGVGVENGRKALDHWTRNKSVLVEMGGSVGSVFVEKSSKL
ncbi:MAG: hypothetical protein M1828_001453 [Chrysothrix sp. TS-e1954]|nr:MAG: hypothetical protein M1828_001453 [Chrysothrix sp. TS-e1954]